MPNINSRKTLDLARNARKSLLRTRRRVSRGLYNLKRRNRLAEDGIPPDRLVWIFGSARTGSTWLGAMMTDLEGHAWENIPDRKKGAGKFYRKGSPGGWSEDLTPEQI